MADFYNNRTFSFRGTYRDTHGEETITITSDGRYLSTNIRGIKLQGMGLYALVVEDENADKDLSILPLQNQEDLCDCYLSMELPVRLVDSQGERELLLLLENWNNAPPEQGHFSSRSTLSCTIAGKRWEVDGDDLCNAMSRLTRMLADQGAHLHCCFTCRLSHYEPFERPQLGEILCFRGMKAEFLSLDLGRPKESFYANNLRERADEYVTETHICKEYVPNVPQMPTRQIFPSPGFLHYWTEGHGPVLLKKLPQVPTQKEVLAEWRKLLEYDALGDEVVRDVYKAIDFKSANALMDKVLRQGIETVPEAPTSLKRMMTAAGSTPDWVNWDKIELGARFCRRSGSWGLIVLRNYCLMGGYESSAINKPLIATGALKKGAAKRMAETVEFWVSATGTGAMRVHAAGFRAAIKVRLMHAYARVAVRASGTWNSQDWGEPINQWDMVATNLGFSLAYLDGLRSLGFRPTDAEVEGLLHFWKYVGYLLGIPPHYLPDTEVEAIRTLYHWTITQPPADEDTRTLARALLDEPLSSKYLPFMWMKRMLRKTHLAYNHFFLGERSCTTMGLPPTRIPWYPRLARRFQSTFQSLVNRSPRVHRFSVRLGRKAQLRIMNIFLGRPANAEVE